MPIIPPFIEGTIVKCPPQPADPPTTEDVILARQFALDLHGTRPRGLYTNAQIAGGLLYEHRVLEAAAGEPAWFRGAFRDAMKDILPAALADALPAVLADALGPIVGEMARICRMCAITHNQGRANGDDEFLEIVFFPDGRDPTKIPYNLPALSSPGAIRGLSAVDRDIYYQGYYPGGHAQIDRRIELIFSAVGSRP